MRHTRGLTLVESLVALACTGVIVALAGGAARMLRPTNGEAISMANEIEIGTAHAMYAWDWGGLQWAGHQSNFGLAMGNCATYVNTIACPPQMLLGWDLAGGLWGYYIGSGMCPGSYPGNCGNWGAYIPNEFTTTNGVFGSWQFMQARSFHNYLNGRFYDEVYYAPNDLRTYGKASRYFNDAGEFSYPPTNPVWSSYAASPASMWHPEVLRAPSDGGFRAPTSFPEAFERQALFSAAYPDLKSLVFERNWNQNPPSSGQVLAGSTTPLFFNGGAASRPITLFYDGHVGYLSNKQAISDDAALIAQGADGLWSRDTPLGINGYYAQLSVDSTRTNHSVLTTEGILGRDILSAP